MSISTLLPPNCIWVTIEGPDKVGKTTLYSKLVPELSTEFSGTFRVVGIPEITCSPTGKAILEAYDGGHFRLKDQHYDSQLGDALLWFADQYNSLAISTASLTGPTILVSDRGPDSRRILQELRLTRLNTSTDRFDVRDWIDSALRFLPSPALTLVLEASLETITARMDAASEYQEYMRKAKEMYERLPLQHPERAISINGEGSPDRVLDDALGIVISKCLRLAKDCRS